jgi:hypothetical protein
MRNVKVSGAIALVMTAACSFHVGTDGAAPPPRSAPPARPVAAAPPPPPPAPAPAPAPHTAMGQTGRVSHAAPAPAPAPAAVRAAPAPAAGSPHQLSPNLKLQVAEALNLTKIRRAQAKSPKGCGFVEVAPSVWVKIDCHAYAPATKAIAHLSARKAKAVSSKKVLFKPIRLNTSLFKAALRSSMMKPGAPSGATPSASERASFGKPGGPPITPDSVPAAVDHRGDNLEGPMKDQGPVGSCTAFSLSTVLDNAAIRAGKMTPGTLEQSASPNHVWAGYGIPQMGTAADANLGRAIATQAIWPANNKENCKLADATFETECGFEENVVPGSWRSDSLIVGKLDKSNATPSYKITTIERLQTQPPNIDELTQTLASGSDLWIAMKIDASVWINSRMKSGVIPDWSSPNGGHAVTMSGFRDTSHGREYLIHNNWGTSWGLGGYAWVSEAMVTKFMHFAYRVKIDGSVKKEDLTDDDCAPDELLDLTSGLCGLICPGDIRPNNGCG